MTQMTWVGAVSGLSRAGLPETIQHYSQPSHGMSKEVGEEERGARFGPCSGPPAGPRAGPPGEARADSGSEEGQFCVSSVYFQGAVAILGTS